MERSEKKRKTYFSFSYIDFFFLLLAGLILSFGIGFLAEVHRENLVESYYVYLSATVEDELSHAIPSVGDTVFGTDGKSIGKVLSVELQEEGNGLLLSVKCRLNTEAPAEGERIMLETSGSIRSMQVNYVERTEQKGRLER